MNPLSSAPTASAGREVPMGSDALYNEQALLRKAVRFVWAVTGMRTAPRRRRGMGAGSACGAEEGAGSACRFQAHLPHPRRVEPAFMPRIKARRFLWEVGTLCLGCILRKENPAPQARIACRLSLPLLCAAIWRRFLWEVIHSIMNGSFYGKWCILQGEAVLCGKGERGFF